MTGFHNTAARVMRVHNLAVGEEGWRETRRACPRVASLQESPGAPLRCLCFRLKFGEPCEIFPRVPAISAVATEMDLTCKPHRPPKVNLAARLPLSPGRKTSFTISAVVHPQEGVTFVMVTAGKSRIATEPSNSAFFHAPDIDFRQGGNHIAKFSLRFRFFIVY